MIYYFTYDCWHKIYPNSKVLFSIKFNYPRYFYKYRRFKDQVGYRITPLDNFEILD